MIILYSENSNLVSDKSHNSIMRDVTHDLAGTYASTVCLSPVKLYTCVSILHISYIYAVKSSSTRRDI